MKNILITGGALGIGLACALKFKEENNNVYVIDKNKQELDKLGKQGFNCIHCDISDYKQVELLKDLPQIDILINNAAIQYIKPFTDTTIKDWNEVINVNLNGTFYVTKLIVPKMKKGQIINIGSVHSTLPRSNKIAYDVTKAGLVMLTKELALELGSDIRVNMIEIGATNTPMNNNFKDKNEEEHSKTKTVLNKILEPVEVANVVYTLTNEVFNNTTGSIITYDAGRSLK